MCKENVKPNNRIHQDFDITKFNINDNDYYYYNITLYKDDKPTGTMTVKSDELKENSSYPEQYHSALDYVKADLLINHKL